MENCERLENMLEERIRSINMLLISTNNELFDAVDECPEIMDKWQTYVTKLNSMFVRHQKVCQSIKEDKFDLSDSDF